MPQRDFGRFIRLCLRTSAHLLIRTSTSSRRTLGIPPFTSNATDRRGMRAWARTTGCSVTTSRTESNGSGLAHIPNITSSSGNNRWSGPWPMGGYAPRALEDGVHPRLQSGASGRPLNFTVRRHAMGQIVPPRRTYRERKVVRRVKAHLWRQWAMVFALLGMGSFVLRDVVITTLSVWLLVLGVIFGGLMLVAAIGAVVYLFVERPQEVTLRIYD